ncbi:MAG TPA: cytochrome c biogenesis protein CcdA [Mycobacteriales bacterium]
MSAVTGPFVLAAPVALAAGAVSFLSPCVLPLVPGYLSYVTGMSGADIGAEVRTRRSLRSRTVLGALLFVLGFSLIFVAYGSFFGGLGDALAVHRRVLQQVFGVITILLGVVFSGLLGAVPLLNREVRPHRLPRAGLAGAPVLGALFGLGWTPCIGPTLAAVQGLALSTSTATAGRGALLTLFYCAGLGLPFLAVALAFRQTMGVLAVVRRHNGVVMAVGGLLLIAVGVAELSGLYQTWVNHLQSVTSGFTPGL